MRHQHQELSYIYSISTRVVVFLLASPLPAFKTRAPFFKTRAMTRKYGVLMKCYTPKSKRRLVTKVIRHDTGAANLWLPKMWQHENRALLIIFWQREDITKYLVQRIKSRQFLPRHRWALYDELVHGQNFLTRQNSIRWEFRIKWAELLSPSQPPVTARSRRPPLWPRRPPGPGVAATCELQLRTGGARSLNIVTASSVIPTLLHPLHRIIADLFV